MTKSAVVTGTSKGLGYELARGLLARGYRVFGVSRSYCSIEDDNYHHLVADITQASYAQALSEFIGRHGIRRIDIVINNAGVASHGTDLESVQPTEVMYQLNLHCVAALATVQALLPLFDGSKIVNITSRLGSVKLNRRGDFAGRGFSYGYRIAKAAQNMLSLCLTADRKLSGTTVISIIPGLLRTDSGADDAKRSAAEGGEAVVQKILSIDSSGIYHAFDDEAAY